MPDLDFHGAACATPAAAMAAPKTHARRLANIARATPANCSFFIGSQTKERKFRFRLAPADHVSQGPAEPTPIVQPSVPCPVLTYKLGIRLRPMMGTLKAWTGAGRPIADALEIERVGKMAGEAGKRLATRGVQATGIARQLCRAGHAQPVSQPRKTILWLLSVRLTTGAASGLTIGKVAE